MYIRLYIRMLLSLCLLTGCSFRTLHETLHVVGEADSLWHQGQMYDDSTQLARTYSALHAWRAFYADEYAHACYHYGKLLRAKEDPVSAMQCFINATHSGTKDYHILGRVYSNMGDICHLAGEYPLSYDIFERSADMFLRNGDTLLYYYGLNNMAFELAEQGKKEETFYLINKITTACSNPDVHEFTKLAASVLYDHVGQYDSVLLLSGNPQICKHASGLILRARAFEHVDELDSALFYAKIVLGMPTASNQDKYNALYMVLNYDSTLQNEELIALSAQRSDIETDVLIPLHNQWAVAIQLLQEDLNRKTDWRWLYSFVAIVLFGCSFIILYYIWRKRGQHQQIIRDIKEKERTITNLSLLQENQHRQLIEDIEGACSLIRQNEDIRTELSWNNYGQMCAVVNRRLYGIADRLQSISLSEKEVRLCILVLLQADTKQMVDMIPYAHSGLGKFKYTTARKLGTTTANLRTFIIHLVA